MSNLLFDTVKVKKPGRNTFDLTHDVKLTTRFGQLTPVMVKEVMPGDKWNISCETMVRFAPMIAPVMHRMDVRTEYFFCPYRLIFPEWEEFITRANTPPVAAPYITVDGTLTAEQLKFLDYMEVPPFNHSGTATVATNINALPFAAYQRIYNDYYRDQNLVNEVDYTLVPGNNNTNVGELLSMRLRAFEHDQFTSSLPFAQKGDAVDIPLGTVSLTNLPQTGVAEPRFLDSLGNPLTGNISQVTGGIEVGAFPTSFPSAYDPDGTLAVEPTTINDLRTALRIQEWLEANARGGTRYIEFIQAHFGVRPSDYRLQRPEYITGVKSPVVISEVLNTTGADGGLPQGNMSGHGISIQDGYNGDYYAEEFGIIIGILSVMPKTSYMQGLPRMYSKFDPFDYGFPEFANLGEEAVLNKEIFAYGPNQNQIWGYLPRYYEYKQCPSRVAGDFRTTLSYWHLSLIFANEPSLSQEFLECNPAVYDLNRIFAVEDPDTDPLYINILHRIRKSSLLPTYGTPML